MTDRIHALTVVLERDTRDDDVEALVNAIRQMRNVADVSPHVSDLSDHSARQMVKVEIGRALMQCIHAVCYDAEEASSLVAYFKSRGKM
jgi:hypothetical protein